MRILLFLIAFPLHACGATAWMPEQNKYFLSYSASANVQNTRQFRKEVSAINKIDVAIDALTMKVERIAQSNKLPRYIKAQRIERYKKLIQNLKDHKLRIIDSTQQSMQNIYIERGINNKYSFGVEAAISNSRNYKKESHDHHEAYIFGKKKIKDNEKWVVSGQAGIKVRSFKPDTSFILGVNVAQLIHKKNGRKWIQEYGLQTSFPKFLSERSYYFSETLQFKTGNMISLSTFYSANKKLDNRYQHYYKDQITFAKKISNSIIPAFEDTTVGLGLYQDYFYRRRIVGSRGIYWSIWIRA